jgi:hypothetical protein
LDWKENHQITIKQIEKNIENGEEYARLIETPYRDLMLDR